MLWRRYGLLAASFLPPMTWEYLRHGGRIGKAAAATGTLLKVKPLIGYQDRELVSDGIAQGRKKSLQRVRDLFFRYVDRKELDLADYRVATGYGLDREEYDLFTQQIREGLATRGFDMPDFLPLSDWCDHRRPYRANPYWSGADAQSGEALNRRATISIRQILWSRHARHMGGFFIAPII